MDFLVIVDYFPFKSETLSGIGMNQADQYGLYIATIVPIVGSIRPLRRAYYINKYVHETDAENKLMIAAKARLTEYEIKASAVFLKNYRAVPRKLAFIPALFIVVEGSRVAFEGGRVAFGKFKSWIFK